MSKQQLKRHGTTFYFASHCLSSSDLEAAAQLYGLCREIDDLADLSSDPDRAAQDLRELIQALRQRDSQHPMVDRALGITPQIDLNVLIELIEGVLSDTQQVRIQTMPELLHYCYQVAGTVGLLMCDLFDVQDPRARHHAVDLGIAMQLTNISRDVVEDAANNRRYLPADWVGDMEPDQMLQPTDEQAQGIQRVVAELLAEADIRYLSGFSGLPFLPTRPRLCILIAGFVYREIGGVIANRGFNVWRPRAYTNRMVKLITAARALFTFAFSRQIHRYRGAHDARLHQGLPRRPGIHLAS